MTKEKRVADTPKQTGRGVGRTTERDYGDYRDPDDEGASRPARDADSRREPVQPVSSEQSGSTGRPAGSGDAAQDGKDTGQDRYGQTGLGGSRPSETVGQANYRQSEAEGDADTKARSNAGPGAVEHEHAEYRHAQTAEKPKPKDRE